MWPSCSSSSQDQASQLLEGTLGRQYFMSRAPAQTQAGAAGPPAPLTLHASAIPAFNAASGGRGGAVVMAKWVKEGYLGDLRLK